MNSSDPRNWKDVVAGQIPADQEREIDNFAAQMALRKAGKIEEKVFAEVRLRRGAYGQRYDNGHRHDGIQTRQLSFSQHTKGPDTHWDAPGMQRIKIPFGGLNPQQIERLADLAEEYSDNILHVTTRQDIQLHYVHIEDAPDLFRRLAEVGITTKEACGNSVRNVTACPLAGICRTETFDVTPYARAVAFYLLGHPDTQDFGRKFKIAFSGCRHEACALVTIHDLGGVAMEREIDGKKVRGFEILVGGGLGAVPHQAKVLEEFVAEQDIFPLARAVGRVFARLGEKRNRNKARIKFVVAKLGIDEFRRVVREELASMPTDDSWRRFYDEIPKYHDQGSQPLVQIGRGALPAGYEAWAATNVYDQRQGGYSTVTVTLPLGDFTAPQARALADLIREFAGDQKDQSPFPARLTVEQNIVLRWVPAGRVPQLYQALDKLGLSEGGAGTIVDVTACPGTDTCKLGIASSRGLAGELRNRLAAQNASLDEAIRTLRIKVSGCFNSCGQHHVADLGFYGNSKTINGFGVPHFQVVLGGKWLENGASYGLAIASIPAKRIPEVVDRITARYIAERQAAETFQAWCQRVGKKDLRATLEGFSKIPPHAEAPKLYTDWGDVREFTIGDLGVGECAGEVVSLADFGFTAAESEAFEAQLALEAGEYQRADELAYNAMLKIAHTLVQLQWLDAPTDPDSVVREFQARMVEPKFFWDTYHAGQFANYLIARHESGPDTRYTPDTTHKIVDEANLFIDAGHKARAKYQSQLNILAPAAG